MLSVSPATRSRRSSLIAALVLALLAVAALPFGLATYQIGLARESLVDQAQQTHLIAVRASVDRIRTALAGLAAAADAAASNPLLWSDPNSAAAREVLAGLLVGGNGLRAAALFFRPEDGGADVLVQLARQPGAAALDAAALGALDPEPSLLQPDAERLMGLSRTTPRPGLRLAVVASADPIAAALEPRELGRSARLVLLEDDSTHPLFADPTPLPPDLLEAVRTPALDALALRGREAAGIAVASFARVPGTRWSLASLQPAEEAEAAAARMRRGAFVAMLAVAGLVALLSLLAWRAVVRPLRGVLAWQQQNLVGSESGNDGDLAGLRAAFASIQRLQRNREALNEVFLGRYQLLSTLGQGAMGSVFLAWDPRLRRHVAIKTIHLQTLDPRMQAALARTLENEAVAVAALQHPNIVSVYDLEAAGQFAFVVMEYVEGGSLRNVIAREGALSPGETAFVAVSLLRALDSAHRAGLLHLDLKPGNVLVPPHGPIRLTDFGVAAWRFEVADLVARGGLAGTPGFIAPEYVHGAAPTERSDLYSLGVLLVECLSGVPQNLHGARTQDLRRAAQRPVRLPEAALRDAPRLCDAVRLLCALDPAQRPGSAAAARVLFEPLIDAEAGARLAARARALGGASSGSGVGPHIDRSAGSTLPGQHGLDTTRPAPGMDPDATRAPPAADDTTRPPPGGAAAPRPQPRIDADATRPPPGFDPDATRAPPLAPLHDRARRTDPDLTRPPPGAAE